MPSSACVTNESTISPGLQVENRGRRCPLHPLPASHMQHLLEPLRRERKARAQLGQGTEARQRLPRGVAVWQCQAGAKVQ